MSLHGPFQCLFSSTLISVHIFLRQYPSLFLEVLWVENVQFWYSDSRAGCMYSVYVDSQCTKLPCWRTQGSRKGAYCWTICAPMPYQTVQNCFKFAWFYCQFSYNKLTLMMDWFTYTHIQTQFCMHVCVCMLNGILLARLPWPSMLHMARQLICGQTCVSWSVVTRASAIDRLQVCMVWFVCVACGRCD